MIYIITIRQCQLVSERPFYDGPLLRDSPATHPLSVGNAPSSDSSF